MAASKITGRTAERPDLHFYVAHPYNGVRLGVMTKRFLQRWAGLIFLCTCAAANTTLDIVPTAQQAVLNVKTDQSTDKCVLAVWTVNADRTQTPANDVNPALFAGSDQCRRDGNQTDGSDLVLVVGRRSAELDQSGVSKASRSLQCLTTYFYRLTIGSDVVTGQFTTANVPLGNTYNEPVFDRARPGEYAYPTIDWTAAGKAKVYVDPLTGIGVKRMSGPGELVPLVQTGMTFMSATPRDTGWTVSGLRAVYQGGNQSKLYYRIADPAWLGGAYGKSADSVALVLSGASSSSGNPMNVCLTNDGFKCAGATVQQKLTPTQANYTLGDAAPILKFWQNSPSVPSTAHDIRTLSGKATLMELLSVGTAAIYFP